MSCEKKTTLAATADTMKRYEGKSCPITQAKTNRTGKIPRGCDRSRNGEHDTGCRTKKALNELKKLQTECTKWTEDTAEECSQKMVDMGSPLADLADGLAAEIVQTKDTKTNLSISKTRAKRNMRAAFKGRGDICESRCS